MNKGIQNAERDVDECIAMLNALDMTDAERDLARFLMDHIDDVTNQMCKAIQKRFPDVRINRVQSAAYALCLKVQEQAKAAADIAMSELT